MMWSNGSLYSDAYGWWAGSEGSRRFLAYCKWHVWGWGGETGLIVPDFHGMFMWRKPFDAFGLTSDELYEASWRVLVGNSFRL